MQRYSFLAKETIEFPPRPEGLSDDGNGVWTFLYDGKLLYDVCEFFDRDPQTTRLKIIKKPVVNDYFTHLWGYSEQKGGPVKDAVIAQNIYALETLAPRVYALIEIIIGEQKYAAMLIEYLGHMDEHPPDNSEMWSKIEKYGREHQIETFNDGRGCNVMCNKYIDFQGFRLQENYKDGLRNRVFGIAKHGRWGPWENYHDIKELSIKGGRNTEHRIKNLGLDRIDFTGKTVLDIGCSEGVFCQYASDHGAKRVVGVDLPSVSRSAGELAYYLGYFNNDYIGRDLKQESLDDLGQFDIVFFFSMGHHVGYLPCFKKIAKDIFIFEGNGKNKDIDIEIALKRDYKKVTHIGSTTDLFDRPVLWASNHD